MEQRLQIVVRGARGSIPVSGEEVLRYGGRTTCFEIDLGDGTRLYIDAGSGLAAANGAAGADEIRECHFLLTHAHWDHLLGLPFFPPFFDPRVRLHFSGLVGEGMDLSEALGAVIRPPWFPVNFHRSGSVKQFHSLPTDDTPLRVGPLHVRYLRLRHPGGVTAYRLERGGRAVVVATDVEAGDPDEDERLAAFARGADVLIHDSQYLPEEYARRRGWGHSTWEMAVRTAERAGVQRLILTSHDPARTDEEIDEIVRRARARFPATDAAAEGMTIPL